MDNSDKYRELGLQVFLLIRKLNELHFYVAQEMIETLVINCGLGEELKLYASSESCNGDRGSFDLISKL